MESSHFLAVSSSCGTLQNVVLRFLDLGPLGLTPKIYSPKLLAITLHYHVATRGRALGTADLPGESRQSTELRADPCCHGNEIWVRRGGPVTYWLVNIY